TDVATAEGAPDNLVSIASLHREVWLFGTQTIEVWDNTGAAFFPFQISGGGFIEQGCVAKFSVAKLDNSMFWLGSDSTGDSIVYRSYGYLPVRISTHPVEEAFRTYSTTADAFAYAYQEEGHLFYVLTFPTGDATWVYDVASKMWHQRAYQDADGFLHRDRVNCHITTARGHYVGDFSNGKIYQQSTAFSDDDGNRVYRERAWEIPTKDHMKQRLDLFELTALSGDGDGAGGAPIVWLQVSQDYGETWGYERQRTLGVIGLRKARARWRRLGSGRNTVLRVATNMPQRVSWVKGIVKGEPLDT
ncbi:MAG: packaged DNA stabilization protein, partial [Candidatus Dormibacteria bacterium]